MPVWADAGVRVPAGAASIAVSKDTVRRVGAMGHLDARLAGRAGRAAVSDRDGG